MFYQTYTPAPALQPFVESYYILEYDGASQTGLNIPVPVNCYAALVFTSRTRLTQFVESRPGEVLPERFVTGPATRRCTLRANGRSDVLGVVLKGAGILRMFGICPSDVLNRRVPLDVVLGPETESLSQQIQEATRREHRIAAIETALLRRLKERDLEVDWIDRAAAIILQEKGATSMDSLGTRLNVCPRHLRRRFKERTGLNPKLFARLKRFNFASLLLSQPALDSQDVIHLSGFYDQAHFIKEFKHFAGARPSEVLKRRRVRHDRLLVEP